MDGRRGMGARGIRRRGRRDGRAGAQRPKRVSIREKHEKRRHGSQAKAEPVMIGGQTGDHTRRKHEPDDDRGKRNLDH